jgi:subtilisin family serine protease
VTPIELNYPEVEVEGEPLSGAASLVNALVRAGLEAAADPGLAGSPAWKPCAVTHGDFGRVPAALVAAPPARRSMAVIGGVRRPMVALLDTAVVADHPWLGPPDTAMTGDGFWIDARRMGWRPGVRLPDVAPAVGPVDRELGEQEGHGTFSAGLIRQVAPDVRVLAVPVMSDAGLVYGDHVLNALGWLLDESTGLVAGDVVCIPIGFRPMFPADGTYLRWLGTVLYELGRRGIVVVAAAGNDGAKHPVYPAAFAASAEHPEPRLVSVGAYNANGTTRARYSNHGDWVSTWVVGTSVVSTFPRVNAAVRAELALDGGREPADPDDFTGGFARWSGTSFAAAIHAGRLAQDRLESALVRAVPQPA